MDIFKKSWFWIVVVAVVIAGAILINSFVMDGEEVALRVNDQEFTQSEFDQTVDRVAQEFQMYGMQASEEEIKDQAIDRLVQEALLLEYAQSEGLDVSQEEIDDEFDEVMMMYGAQSEEEFLAQLESEGFEDKTEVEDVLEFEVQINKLLEIYSDNVEVTDEELEEAYEDYVAQMEQMQQMQGEDAMDQEIPSLEELEEELRADMIEQKATPLLLETIEEMREDADIEVFVDEDEVEDLDMEEEMQVEPEPGQEDMEIEIDEDDIEDGDLELDPEDL